METLSSEVPREMWVEGAEDNWSTRTVDGELTGGGAFSGNDYTKVDRSAANAAR